MGKTRAVTRCERCDCEMDGSRGLLGRFLSSSDGYICESCGTAICDECYAQRRRELVSGAYRFCRVCDGALRSR